jgi:cAMP-dependent protein kinase regulator
MMFCLDRSVYQAITREFNIARRQRFENYLSKIDILHDLTSEERTSLAEIFYCETYHAGNKAETIAYQGEPGNKLVVIDSGNATAFHTKSTHWLQ